MLGTCSASLLVAVAVPFREWISSFSLQDEEENNVLCNLYQEKQRNIRAENVPVLHQDEFPCLRKASLRKHPSSTAVCRLSLGGNGVKEPDLETATWSNINTFLFFNFHGQLEKCDATVAIKEQLLLIRGFLESKSPLRDSLTE